MTEPVTPFDVRRGDIAPALYGYSVSWNLTEAVQLVCALIYSALGGADTGGN